MRRAPVHSPSRSSTAGLRPRLKPGVRATVAAPDLVLLSSERDESLVEGRLLPLLAPLVDGTRTIREIANALRGRAGLIDVQFGLGLLDEGGWLAPAAARARAARPVRVVVTDDYMRRQLDATDRRAHTKKETWMPVRFGASTIWIGPIMRPGGSPCWRCVVKRLQQNRPLEVTFRRDRSAGRSRGGGPVIAALARNLARAVASTLDPDVRQRLQRQIVTIDLASLTSASHEVLADPACPCSRGSQSAAPPHDTRSRRGQKTLVDDGGYRTVSANESFRRFARHVSPLTGIVGRVEPYYDDPDGLIHVYTADHAFVVDPLDRASARRGFRRKSTGKGMTPAQARTSALCEALERASGVYRGTEPTTIAAYDMLGDRAVLPNACLGFSERQFAARAATNRVDRPQTWVPDRFQEDRPIAWTPAWSLTHARRRYVPTALCYYGVPRDPDHDFCRADSNGAAAGNTRDEAILQGFFELVERDAVAIWWYNRVPRPGVDLSSFEQPYVRAVARRYERLGRPLQLLDLTTDFGVPVFAAISRARAPGRGACIFGFGAHFDAGIAVARAVTEVNQFLPLALERTLADRYGRFAHLPFLRPARGARSTIAGSTASPVASLRDAVKHAVASVKARGLEMLTVDQTRPDIGLSVVKVIVPGLRPFWPRFAPGRVYDVPVALGWRTRASKEEDLNPVPFFV